MAKSKSAAIPKVFPLTLHKGSGQWCKKVLGKIHYFGKDREAALNRWIDEKDYLLAGRKPPRTSGTPTVSELANVFHDAYKKRVDIGKVSQRHLDGCKSTLDRFIQLVGKDCHLDCLQPMDFDDVRHRLYEPSKNAKPARGGVTRKTIARRSHSTVDGDVRRILLFIQWALAKKLLPSVDMGMDFKPSSRKESRVHKSKQPKKLFSKQDLVTLFEKCSVSFKPMILLGINAGIGGLDIANITFKDIEGLAWVDLPRLKTGAERRFILWPQTKAAIQAYLKVRPAPRKGDEDIVFLTSKRWRWVRSTGSSHTDSISSGFTSLRKEAGLSRGTFYDLRRTFATIGCETLDTEAVRHIMGHVSESNDVLAQYNQQISDERIKLVCDHVRKWLFGGSK